MGIYTFFFLNFIVSFLSDIVLSDLSTDKGQNIFKSDIIKSLRPYFKNKFIIESAIYAGLTVVIALAILSLITYKAFKFKFKYPTNNRELAIYCSIGFALGYFVDFVIYKTKPFGQFMQGTAAPCAPSLFAERKSVLTPPTNIMVPGLGPCEANQAAPKPNR